MNTILHDAVRHSNDLASATRSKYLRDLDAWAEFAGADETKWTRKQAIAFEQSMIDRGLSMQSANRVMVSVRYAMRTLAQISGDPNMDVLAEPRPGMGPLTQPDQLRLLNLIDGDQPMGMRDRALIILGLETGMHKVAIASMTIEGLNMTTPKHDRLQPPQLTALVQAKTYGNEPKLTVVSLSKVVDVVLASWVEWLAQHNVTRGPLFRGILKRSGGFYPKHLALSTSMIQKAIGRRGKDAEIDNVSVERLRRTYLHNRADMAATPSWLQARFGVGSLE